jgi:hypothetical protein
LLRLLLQGRLTAVQPLESAAEVSWPLSFAGRVGDGRGFKNAGAADNDKLLASAIFCSEGSAAAVLGGPAAGLDLVDTPLSNAAVKRYSG